jgi:hypothetical protein
MYLPLREQDSVAVVDTAKVLAGDPSALLTVIGAGISPHLAAVRPATATVVATTTRYTGQITQNFDGIANLSATLVVQGTSAPIPGQTITFTLGTQSCAGTTDASGVAACSITLNQAPGSYTVTASFSGSANQQASSDSRGFTITAVATVTAYTGETTQNYHDIANLSATLVEQGTLVPIPGQTITFTLGTQSCTGTTGATGVAACSITLNQVPGSYTVSASFAGSANQQASSASAGFTISREETAIAYTGPTVIANGANTTFSAVLKEDGAVAIAGRTITIMLGSGSTGQTCSGTTDATGTASCSILVNQPLGPGTVAAGFAGDALYLPSSNGASTILFAFPARGAFVLGNQTASGAVEFWGDDWATVNMLSGGLAPDAFKGFAASTSEPPACGSAWTTDPGNSSQPPAGTLPSFMGVVVSTRVSQSGSTISGDVFKIMVVTPNAGYGPDPGQHGTGTVVATYCTTGGYL